MIRTCDLSDTYDGLMASACTLFITHKQTLFFLFLEPYDETPTLPATGSLIQNAIEWDDIPIYVGGI